MASPRLLSRRSRTLTYLLLGVAVPPAATLVWLGVQLLQQERSLQAQRLLERHQTALDGVVRSLESSLAQATQAFGAGPVPAGVTRLTFSDAGGHAEPEANLLWWPTRPAARRTEPGQFAQVELLEFGDPKTALASYQALTRSSDVAVRAGALLRVARVLRRIGDQDGALAAYDDLAHIDTPEIEGAPADLQARRAAAGMLADAGRVDAARARAAAIESDLLAGRWRLDRPAWALTVADLTRWLGRGVALPPQRVLMSEVADQLWQQPDRQADAAGHRVLNVQGAMVTVLLDARDRDRIAVVIPPEAVHAWAQTALRGLAGRPRLTLFGNGGSIVAGAAPATEMGGLKASALDTDLPWSVTLGPIEDPVLTAVFATRRRLLAAGLCAILLLLGGGSYFLWRVVEREMAVARLQTDFVAAVSHELRTPLTSLRHVTELLQEDDALPPAERAAFYDALARNTDRLHRLVESLLDFARLDSGRTPLAPESLDAGALVSAVVADFRTQTAAGGVAIDVEVEAAAPRIQADRASLSTALWNLLDNAVKYSPSGAAVRVTVGPHPSGVAVAVRDHGLGVPSVERAEIFKRFVRGAQAQHLGIRGTGLGLAMASQIVEAHGGRIELDSEEGAGSTFRVVLPAMS